jgi:DNA ligase-1
LIDTGTLFLKLANLLRKLEATGSRNKKIEISSSFLNELDSSEISPAIMLISGAVFPEGDRRVLEVSGRTLHRVLTTHRQMSLERSSLTITSLFDQLQGVASISGKGSRSKKEAIVSALIGQASEIEKEYVIRILLGELRIGLAEGLILESVSKAANVEIDPVRGTYTLIGDIGETAKIALLEGERGLKRIGLRLFEPIKPMLADTTPDFENIFKTHGGKSALEYKLDGARVQIHKKAQHVEIFTRRLANITSSLPEIVDLTSSKIRAQDVILEGEVVAVDQPGRPMPFQELMRRFRRSDLQEAINEVHVKLFLFDLLYFEHKPILNISEDERRQLLERICPEELLTPRLVTSDLNQAKDFFNKAIEEGHEGLVAKALDGRYLLGQRRREWLKIKQAETLDTIIVAVDGGSGRRRGWLSNYHLAIKDTITNKYLEIGKTFKGLTDEEFEYMTNRLLSLRISDDGLTVKVKPKVVVEVTYDEVQKSPRYNSGYALRFARITHIREDKSSDETDTLEKVKEVYENQFRRKAKPQ